MINPDARKKDWIVITSEINEQSKSIKLNELEVNIDKNYIIVLSDEKGLSESLLKLTDHNILIPPMLDINKINKFPFNITNKISTGCECSIILNHIKSQFIK